MLRYYMITTFLGKSKRKNVINFQCHFATSQPESAENGVFRLPIFKIFWDPDPLETCDCSARCPDL